MITRITTCCGRVFNGNSKSSANRRLLGSDPEVSRSLIQAVRDKHGDELEIWWQKEFGYGFGCLTQSEARYLERSQDADTIRSRMAAAGQGTGD